MRFRFEKREGFNYSQIHFSGNSGCRSVKLWMGVARLKRVLHWRLVLMSLPSWSIVTGSFEKSAYHMTRVFA